MQHCYTFSDTLAASARATWQIEDVLPESAQLDFSRAFLPDALTRTAAIETLSEDERLTLNHIRGHEYLSLFGLVEEFILPFVLDHARPQLSGTDHRIRVLLQFAGEEAKHIQLFKRFHQRFQDGFETPCDVIGPPEAVAAEVLRHDPLTVALFILHIEWMSQRHYLESVRDDTKIDPLFRSLLKHHWMEEAQHAKLDTLIVEALAEGRDGASIMSAIDEYFEIIAFLDHGFRTQVDFNLEALELAIGRTLGEAERQHIKAAQHQALRWTYLGSGMTHPNFMRSLRTISPEAHDRIAAATPMLC